MAQVLQVLLCVSCKTYQVQIKKKSTKWVCKLCGTKQTLQKVIAAASGAECRKIVQELNLKRGQLLDAEPKNRTSDAEADEEEEVANCEQEEDQNEVVEDCSLRKEEADSNSKWGFYVDEVPSQSQVAEGEQDCPPSGASSSWSAYSQQSAASHHRNELY